jgi:alpha-glucosidase
MTANWFDNCAIYQIYPRSFQDSTGDGVGDLEGIRRRLGYIADLGVDAIWISPFYPSPMKDFGYDVADYRGVDPMFGTLEDFTRLLAEAHACGLKVVIDQVWSHTSDQHPWFADSRSAPGAPRADWYVWADAKPDGTPPNNWQSVFGGPAWTWDSGRHQYYLHNFLTSQPDLNFHNPAVEDAVLDVARFWLDLGVDGFRLDVCNFYFHNQSLADNPVRADGRQGPKPHDWQAHVHCRSQPENLAFLARLRALADGYGDRLLLGEIGDDRGTQRQIEYTSGTARLHMAYSFDLLTRDASPAYLGKILRQWLDAGEGTPLWAIGNHDVPRVASRWAGGAADPRQPRLFAAFLACLPGPICLYQGDELGLEQVDIPFEELRDPEGLAMWPRQKGRDGCRTPMVWNADEANAGFSTADKTWLRIGPSHVAKAVDRQSDDPASLLNFYRRLLPWRRGLPGFGKGRTVLLDLDPAVLAWTTTTDRREVFCAFNFTPETVSIPVPPGLGTAAACVVEEGVRRSDQELVLDPFGFTVLEAAGAASTQELAV